MPKPTRPRPTPRTSLALALCAGLSLGMPGPPAQAATPPAVFVDTHVDIPSTYMAEPRYDAGTDTPLQVDLGKMARGGLHSAFFIVYVPQGPLTAEGYAEAVAEAERKFDAIHRLVDTYPERIGLALTPDQVLANHAAGRLSAMIGIENGHAIGGSLERLDAAHARGARYLGLTHFGHNDICTSSVENTALGDSPAGDRGLSDFGRQVVERANRLGMMLDVSHASDACARDVLAASRAPIIASHSNARALLDHPRNLDDDLLRGIAAGGGMTLVTAVGIYLRADPVREAAVAALRTEVATAEGAEAFDYEAHMRLPTYLDGMARIDATHPPAGIDDLVDHVAHIVKVAGIDHVGVSSDFDGGGGIAGWQDASETANVVEGLRRRGFDEAEVAKIIGGNLLRVWRTVESLARDD